MDYYAELDKRISLIKDMPVHDFTWTVVHRIPESIWKMPSSFRHHLPDERGEWGNAIHSLRVTDLSLVIADSLLVVGMQKDCLISAALLHDIGKRGLHGDASIIQTSRHPYLVREIIKSLGGIPGDWEAVLYPIECHMGKWSANNLPDFLSTKKADNSMILHLADCIVARWAEVIGTGG